MDGTRWAQAASKTEDLMASGDNGRRGVMQAHAMDDDSKRRVRKGLWAAGGFAAFALGAVGVALPVIPTTPFMLLAAFCFARSSQRVDDWFHSTKLYHKVLEGYVTKRSMTVKAKLTIIIPVTLLMGVAFFLMWRKSVTVGCVILAIVWLAHIVYFGLIVKTDR